MKRYLIFGLLLATMFSVGVVLAAKPERGLATVNPSGGQAMVFIPSRAIEIAPGIFSLGTALDHNGKEVEGYAYIDYKKGFAKPSRGGSGATASCYSFLANGAKWKTTESYVVASDIDAILTGKDFETWDTQVAFDVFGTRDLNSVADGADTVSPDNKNEIMWGNIDSPGAIAVTIVWGVFGGKPSERALVEYDVVFDNTDFVWGDATVNPSVMDFENIATHEFGHAAGLADLYQPSCSEQTMYGYANYGEIKKRDLEIGDIAGIKALYK